MSSYHNKKKRKKFLISIVDELITMNPVGVQSAIFCVASARLSLARHPLLSDFFQLRFFLWFKFEFLVILVKFYENVKIQ